MTRRYQQSGQWVVAVSMLLSCTAVAQARDRDEIYHQLELFTDVVSIVQSDYVKEPDAKDLIYGAMEGMLASLDPYSQFMDPDAYQEVRVETGGKFGGLGIEITIKDDLLTIISPLDDTPAQQAGLMAGDRIVRIDGELTRDITLIDAVKKLRGEPGTEVVLGILRESEERLFEVAVTRDIIKMVSIKQPSMIDEGVGYVRISEFQEETPDDFEKALDTLVDEGMEALVLDLRNNPGGLLDVAVDIADFFLESGTLVVSTRGRSAEQTVELRARHSALITDMPIVVMVNQGSASASEIVAGALQDHHQAVVLGTTSFGKGSVQTITPLSDGSALRLTTSTYFTPSGRSIQEEGIHPDVEVAFVPQTVDDEVSESEEVFVRIQQEEEPETSEADQLHEARRERLSRDNQLARAVDLLKGILVYEQSAGAPDQSRWADRSSR